MKEKLRPRVTVAAIIVKNGKVLLGKRNTEPFRNYWTFPGGHIDFGETPEEAAVRESKEEVGLNIKPKFIGYFTEYFPKLKWHAIALAFYSDKFTGKLKAQESEIEELQWINLRKAAKMKLGFEDEKKIQAYLKFVRKK